MIRFTTKNSKYEVTVQENMFHIKKFEAINPKSDRIAVGQTIRSHYLQLELGVSARFAGILTTDVEHIEDV